MNLNPALGQTDRIASVAAGVLLIVYASLADFDKAAVWAGLMIVGAVFVIGGIAGT
ncbi:MAG TPA: hypothetical protein VLV83_01455 [Acidobacteriota bacterium]|nr:hypothetical protein [Acidobacteriota bacterium]